jgi:ketopantoate reductase
MSNLSELHGVGHGIGPGTGLGAALEAMAAVVGPVHLLADEATLAVIRAVMSEGMAVAAACGYPIAMTPDERIAGGAEKRGARTGVQNRLRLRGGRTPDHGAFGTMSSSLAQAEDGGA